MESAKVFMINKSQNVRIPKSFRLNADEVFIERKGDQLILTPKDKGWHALFGSINDIPAPKYDAFKIPDDLPNNDELF